jgi:protein disulfide-isomerase-like protein
MLALLIAAFFTVSAQAAVQVLNDDTFEKVTQASTGMTTGNWFVKFYAPWCGHCQALAPIFEAAEEEVRLDWESEPNPLFAEVDCIKATKTCKRFNVKAYPTLGFLVRGKYVEYTDTRDTSAIVDFVQQDWNIIIEGNAESQIIMKDMPAQMTAFNEFVIVLKRDLEELWKFKKNAILVAVAVGFVLGWIVKGLFPGAKTKED